MAGFLLASGGVCWYNYSLKVTFKQQLADYALKEEKMDYIIRSYRAGEERYVADAHRRIYSEEYRWGDSFIDYAVKIAMDFPQREKSEKEELLVAQAEGKLVGCIMLCQSDEAETGQLRLFLVEKECRGCGVGRALTNELLSRARAAGYKKLMLWTASPLKDAIRQYEKIGFKVTEEVENTDWSLDGELIYEIRMDMELK